MYAKSGRKASMGRLTADMCLLLVAAAAEAPPPPPSLGGRWAAWSESVGGVWWRLSRRLFPQMKIAREAVMAMKAKAAASRVKRLRPEIGASVPAFMRTMKSF